MDFDSIDACLTAAMRADDRVGATGRWVGLLGFSQGAAVAAHLLLRQQTRTRNQSDGNGEQGPDYHFAVLLAGRALFLPENAGRDGELYEAGFLRQPTVHVHGLRDPGIELHRRLFRYCSQRSRTRLVEWDGDHRVPIKTKDVAAVVAEIKLVALECGV
jgi:predicted esterase